jgi:hypothetical protein
VLEKGSINIVVILLKMFSLNFSTGNYETCEEYRSLNRTTDLSSSLKVNTNKITKRRRDILVEKDYKDEFFILL